MTTKRNRATRRKKLRVLVLMHEDFVPPDDTNALSEAEFHRIKTESDILKALDALGHETKALGVRDALGAIRRAIEDWKPSFKDTGAKLGNIQCLDILFAIALSFGHHDFG